MRGVAHVSNMIIRIIIPLDFCLRCSPCQVLDFSLYGGSNSCWPIDPLVILMAPFSQAVREIALNHSQYTFPQYLKLLVAQNVVKYTVTLMPHSCIFESATGETITHTNPSYDISHVATEWRPELLKETLKQAQTGVIDYHGFVKGAGEAAGVHHYTIDFKEHKADYRSSDDLQSYIESIPAAFFTL